MDGPAREGDAAGHRAAATAEDTARRVLAAIGSDPTQAFVWLDGAGRPRWASPSLFSLFAVDLAAPDPLTAALHPDDAALVAEIYKVEQHGRADETFDLDRRFELQVRLKAPGGRWRWVSLRLHNRLDDPSIAGMVLQLTLANQEHSSVEAFDAAARGAPLAEVLEHVLDTLCSGGSGDSQAVVFDGDDRCLAATHGIGLERGASRSAGRWQELSRGRIDLTVPVVGPSGEGYGTLVTISNFPDVRPFTHALTVSVARRLGWVLEAERAREELHRQAVSDPLTGLSNRRVLYDHLERDDLAPYASVAFVDLDGFKAVNDRFGHHVGDELLVEVARRLRSVARPGDVLARTGGDEFVLLRSGGSEAEVAIDRTLVVDAIEGDLLVAGAVVPVSASVGVATGNAGRRLGLVAEADAAMYASKPHRRRDPA